jgi:DnaJ-class molecular chaperone
MDNFYLLFIVDCYTCDGSGTWDDGTTCPECRGSGEMNIDMPSSEPETCSICGAAAAVLRVDEHGLPVCC